MNEDYILTPENYPKGWEHVFTKAKRQIDHATKMLNKLEQKYGEFYPLRENIFKAFEMVPLNKVKVVIIGQDPYPHICRKTGKPTAQGFSFSVDQKSNIPASLKNIFTVMENNIVGFKRPLHGDLSKLCDEGVLFLNFSLTVSPEEKASHLYIWQGFFKFILEAICSERPNAVFVLWGSFAKELKDDLGHNPYILGAHPVARDNSFIKDAKYFTEINKKLKSRNLTPVDWLVLSRD